MRSRASRVEWARRIARWRRSGLPAQEFAARIGVNRNTFAHWVWRLGAVAAPAVDDGKGAARFIEVVGAVAGPAEEELDAAREAVRAAELVLRDGLRLRVAFPVDVDAARSVATLVAALERR